MTFARHQCSKLMSRDMGLVGLLRYFPLAQFTKTRPVDSLGPFSLESLKTGFVMATRLPATRGCTAHTNDAWMYSSPCATLRVPQALGGYSRGGDPTTPTDEPTRCT